MVTTTCFSLQRVQVQSLVGELRSCKSCRATKSKKNLFYIFLCPSISGVKVAQLCPTLCDPMDFTVHGILQARILEWVAFPFSRGSSQHRDRTQVSCIAGRFFTSRATRETCYTPKRHEKMLPQKKCTQMFTVVLLKWPNPELTQISSRQMWCIHTMEYYPAIKGNGVLIHE